MTRLLALFALLTLVSLSGCRRRQVEPPTPAAAPSVQVAPSGVHVAAPDREVAVSADGVAVRGANGERVHVGAGGVRVEAAEAAQLGALQVLVDQVRGSSASPAALVCRGSETLVRHNVVLDGGEGPAIAASGSCDVVCNNCRLTSRSVAIAASGSSNVVLNGCTVEAPVAVAVSGSADVVSNGSNLRGRTTRSGNGTLTLN